jgi:hypothetical protein
VRPPLLDTNIHRSEALTTLIRKGGMASTWRMR